MPSRRDVLQALGVGAVASASLGAASVASAGSARSLWSADAPPWWLIDPLTAGTSLGRGWRVEELSAVQEGASVLTLSHRDGRIARVHICAREGRPQGVACTGLFDFVLMDGAQGDRPTEESLGRVLRQVARRARRAEQRVGEDELRMVVGLRSHPERVARYGAEALV